MNYCGAVLTVFVFIAYTSCHASCLSDANGGNDLSGEIIPVAQEALSGEREAAPAAQRGSSAGSKVVPRVGLFQAFRLNQRGRLLSGQERFSDKWWELLFDSRGCDWVDSDKEIDCTKMLEVNPQWQEIEREDNAVKKAVMRRALHRYITMDDASSLACAVCAGGSPNERLGDVLEPKRLLETVPHTALHIVSGLEFECKQHYGLFSLLLSKGADPNESCTPLRPMEFFVPKYWYEVLKVHGAHDSSRDWLAHCHVKK